ncbi:hypothetical protein NLU13_5519 [Sarocladium strictum]|uniref:BRCT domain-containing protein n=1 Tax=Sarocladium strictum TaxID=5046 RepID=A0AA39GHM2_SARSR|nr:hypothetical protein NLU13_5519 [Sarocladium strictum]
MPPPKSALPKAAAPRYGAHFDAWNSSSSGHQRPDNQPGTGWRESRNQKLSSQFRSGASGGARLSDTWGAGSPDWDDKRKVIVPQALKERKTGQKSVADMLVRPGRMREVLAGDPSEVQLAADDLDTAVIKDPENNEAADQAEQQHRGRHIFDGVVVYVNGSTFPLVSDHRLKQILSENGGNMSLHLGRRKVTHVILGRPAGRSAAASARGGRGAGGGLAGGKIEKEIKRIGGCGVKFVGVEWVLESLKAGKRLPEARFATLKVAAQGQHSVYGRYAERVTHEASSSKMSNGAAGEAASAGDNATPTC